MLVTSAMTPSVTSSEPTVISQVRALSSSCPCMVLWFPGASPFMASVSLDGWSFDICGFVSVRERMVPWNLGNNRVVRLKRGHFAQVQFADLLG